MEALWLPQLMSLVWSDWTISKEDYESKNIEEIVLNIKWFSIMPITVVSIVSISFGTLRTSGSSVATTTDVSCMQ